MKVNFLSDTGMTTNEAHLANREPGDGYMGFLTWSSLLLCLIQSICIKKLMMVQQRPQFRPSLPTLWVEESEKQNHGHHFKHNQGNVSSSKTRWIRETCQMDQGSGRCVGKPGKSSRSHIPAKSGKYSSRRQVAAEATLLLHLPTLQRKVNLVLTCQASGSSDLMSPTAMRRSSANQQMKGANYSQIIDSGPEVH